MPRIHGSKLDNSKKGGFTVELASVPLGKSSGKVITTEEANYRYIARLLENILIYATSRGDILLSGSHEGCPRGMHQNYALGLWADITEKNLDILYEIISEMERLSNPKNELIDEIDRIICLVLDEKTIDGSKYKSPFNLFKDVANNLSKMKIDEAIDDLKAITET